MLLAEDASVIGLGNAGEWFTVWAVRVCIAAYFTALLATVLRVRRQVVRSFWTIGCVACVAHIFLAMHFYHRWSHAAAYADTVRQTREATGLAWGGGIYFNYLFAAIWMLDVLWWWVSPASRAERSRWISAAIQAYLVFIVINATIVFETGATRWVSCAAASGLLVIGLRAWLRNRKRGAGPMRE